MGTAGWDSNGEFSKLLGERKAATPSPHPSGVSQEAYSTSWTNVGDADSDEATLADAPRAPTVVQVAGGAEDYTVDKDVFISDAERRAAADGAPQTLEYAGELIARIKRMHNFVSHDYDPVDTDLDRRLDGERELPDYRAAETWKWLLSFAIGAIMGVVAFAVDVGIARLTVLKYRAVLALIAPGRVGPPVATYILLSAGLAAVAGGLVSYLEPLAAGSGIPEMKTYLNGVHIPGLMSLRTLGVKLVGIVFSIAAGLVAGKEGPFVHGGGIVGGGVAAMGSQTLTRLLGWPVRAPRALGGQFRSDADHRDFAAIGTAAGVATAFNAPIGGLLFTVEEGCSFYSTSVFWRGFLATCTGVMTLHCLVEWRDNPGGLATARFGIHRDFGLYDDKQAAYGQVFYYHVWELPIFALMGACGGLAGAAFIRMNVELTLWRHRWVSIARRGARTIEVVVVAVVTAVATLLVTYASPCHLVPQGEHSAESGGATAADALTADIAAAQDDDVATIGGHNDYFPRLWCPPNHFSLFGQLFFVPISKSLRLLIHLGEPVAAAAAPDVFRYTLVALIMHTVLTYFLMTWTYGIGAASGLFVPSLAVGASAGRLTGQMASAALAWLGLPYRVSLPAYAVLGAASVLGGATRMTLSITVLVMETTGALQLIVPLMLAIFVAKTVGDFFGLGIYDTHIKLRGAPTLDEPNLGYLQRMQLDKLTVADVASRRLQTLPPLARVGAVIDALRSPCSHSAIPVTTEGAAARRGANPGFRLDGIVSRQMLLKLLKHRCALWPPDQVPPEEEASLPPTPAERKRLQGLLQHRPLKVAEADVPAILRSFSLADRDLLLDLRPFMQRHPHVIPADAPLSRAYRLFRTLGLRHLIVAPPKPRVIGVLTRKDLTSENAALKLGELVNQGNMSWPQAGLRRPRKALPFIPYQPYDAPALRRGSGSAAISEEGAGAASRESASGGAGGPGCIALSSAHARPVALAAGDTASGGGGTGGGRLGYRLNTSMSVSAKQA